MLNLFNSEASGLSPQEIARLFRWLGWVGFALQALLGFIPILVIIANLLFRPGQQINPFSFGLFLAIACALALLFSTYWCFRYIQLGNRIETPNARPAKAEVLRDLKIGLLVNFAIMAIAVLIALVRVGELTVRMLSLPQGATVITPGQLGTTVNPGALVTPSNMIAIQAMVNAMAAGLVGAIVALILLSLVGQPRKA